MKLAFYINSSISTPAWLHGLVGKMTHVSMALTAATALCLTTSCSGILDTDSELVEFEEDNHIDTPQDSVYSVMGIIYNMQKIADRTVILGEMRGDLLTPTDHASAALKDVANFNIGTDNTYNAIADYFAVINNCNFYLSHVDSLLTIRNKKVFADEVAAVRTYRAWAYLEAAKVYGSLPLVTTPIVNEHQAQEALKKQPSSLTDICNFFIDDLKNLVNVDLPNYGTISGMSSQQFFIPVRVLLGDLCLWAGRYQEAATYYHDYLTRTGHEVPTGTSRVAWASNSNRFENVSNGYSSSVVSTDGGTSAECSSYIPMETSAFDGINSDLKNIYNSTELNNYYYQVTPSEAMRSLSARQVYCLEYHLSDTKIDTLYSPKEKLANPLYAGDLRLYANYSHHVNKQSSFSKYSSYRQTLQKINSYGINLCRRQLIYLHFAEALNRAGFPESAFCILKYGLCNDNISKYISEKEREAVGSLLDFNSNVFTTANTQGIHSRGCGDSPANAFYVLPEPATELASRADTVAYQMPLVEDLIVDEEALEGSFEGQRFYDLMRVALRRNDPNYLADPVSRRDGERNDALYQKLLNTTNWYLPKQ